MTDAAQADNSDDREQLLANLILAAMDAVDFLRPKHGGKGGDPERCAICRAVDAFDAALEASCDAMDRERASA